MTDEVAERASRASRLRPFRGFLIAAAISAVVLVIWKFDGATPSAAEVPRIGSVAPDFTLQDTRGQIVQLADYRGKTVLMNFWATWCPPCQAEMPAIDQVARANPNLVVMAVDVAEGPTLVREFLLDRNFVFTPLLDPSGSVTALYHVDSLPTSIFIGPDGVVRAINVGALDQPSIEAYTRQSA